MGENFWCPKGILRRYIQSHKFDALTSNQKINLIKCIVISVPNVRTAEDLLRTALFGKTAECRLRHEFHITYVPYCRKVVTRVDGSCSVMIRDLSDLWSGSEGCSNDQSEKRKRNLKPSTFVLFSMFYFLYFG